MGLASSSPETTLYLPSPTATPSAIQLRCEGGPEISPLTRSKAVSRCVGTLDDLESHIAEAAQMCATPGIIQALGGLRLDFECKTGVANRELLKLSFNRVLGACVILIHTSTPGQMTHAPRVTTPRGMTWLYLSLQDLKAAESSLLPSRAAGEECPVCMDRPVTVALSCGHAYCKVCQVEWLEGEGRGTCPLCRSAESEKNEWVLGVDGGDEATVQHAENVVTQVLCFLSALPPVADFSDQFQMPWGGAALWSNDNRSPRDVLAGWLRSEIAQPQAPRCAHCHSAMRVPPTAEQDSRLICAGCQRLVRVKDLGAPTKGFYQTLKGGEETWRLP